MVITVYWVASYPLRPALKDCSVASLMVVTGTMVASLMVVTGTMVASLMVVTGTMVASLMVITGTMVASLMVINGTMVIMVASYPLRPALKDCSGLPTVCSVTQTTLCNPKARILERVAISFSRASF